MAKAVEVVAKVQNVTQKAAVAYVVDRTGKESRIALEARAAGIVWGAWNPGAFLEVMAGRTPRAWKDLRTEVDAKAKNADAVKLWVTDVKKSAAVLSGINPAALKADVDNGTGPQLKAATQWLEAVRLKAEGATFAAAAAAIADVLEKDYRNPHGVRQAFAAAFVTTHRAEGAGNADAAPAADAAAAPDAVMEPAAEPVVEAAPVRLKVRVRNLSAALQDAAAAFAVMVDPEGDDKPAAADLERIALAVLAMAPERIARRIAAAALEAADLKSAPTAEAEAAAAANEAADAAAAAAPAKATRKRRAA